MPAYVVRLKAQPEQIIDGVVFGTTILPEGEGEVLGVVHAKNMTDLFWAIDLEGEMSPLDVEFAKVRRFGLPLTWQNGHATWNGGKNRGA